jgi:hypothetical protein
MAELVISDPDMPGNVISFQLFDEETDSYVDGALSNSNYYNSIITLPEFNAINLQNNTSTILNIILAPDAINLQNNTSTILNIILAPDAILTQRFNVGNPIKIIWLMRARNKDNTRYIYWRSPGVPSYIGYQTQILINTVETVGSIYQ